MNDELDVPDTLVPGAAYRSLLQIALFGTELGETGRAIEIAEALAELRADLPHASIVLAMSEFSAGRRDAGVYRLQDTLVTFKDSQLAKAMLAVCLQNTGRPGWQPLLESVIEDGRDEYAVGLASALLGREVDAADPARADATAAAPGMAMWA